MLFYRVEIRRVGRQVKQPAAPLLDELLEFISVVGREVVHHHSLPLHQRRSQEVLHVALDAIEEPIPSTVMLASTVVFAPLFLGVPVSSTNIGVRPRACRP
jgi:hypothetical protein